MNYPVLVGGRRNYLSRNYHLFSNGFLAVGRYSFLLSFLFLISFDSHILLKLFLEFLKEVRMFDVDMIASEMIWFLVEDRRGAFLEES